MSTLYTIGQANQVMDAFEAAGFTPTYMTKLQQYKELASFKAVLDGVAQILPTKHVIDCDADPFLPDGWKVEEHIKGGQWEWNPDQIELYLAEGQKNGGYVNGHELRKQLKDKPILNANVLDYLLAHQELIPEEWKGKRVYFWGTVYRHSDGNLYVRCLYWNGRTWDWDVRWLDDDWGGDDPAAFRK